jgi:hypothetical protein
MKEQKMAPPKLALAAITRKSIEMHTWDTFSSFDILRWDADRGELTPRVRWGIADDVKHSQYPPLMINAAAEYHAQNPDEPAYAYLFTYELNWVDIPDDTSLAEDARLAEMLATHTLGEHPDAREQVAAWCIDIHGRGWCATQFRDEPDVIEETFYRPGSIPRDPHLNGMLAVAYGTGMTQYGLPGPQQRHN